VDWPLAKVRRHLRSHQNSIQLTFSSICPPANKLWARANPYRNRHGRRTCAEVAIATAERIFTFQYDQAAGVAPYLSPEQAAYDPVRSVGFAGSGRRSRRGSWSYYNNPPGMVDTGILPVGAIPIGGRTYQNAQGYNIVDSPMGVPFPQEIQRSPRIIPTAMAPDPYMIPTAAPGSYGGGGYPINAPGSYGAGGGGYPVASPSNYVTGVGSYGAPVSGYGGGYESALLGPPQYHRQRSYSQGYRPGY